MEFPQVIAAFRTTVEDLTEALNAFNLQDPPLSNLRSYLHSESDSILASSESIFSITSTSPGSSFDLKELVESIATATKFLQLKNLDPNDESTVGTMNLRLLHSASTIEGDLVSSLQVTEQHFAKISSVQNRIIQTITDSPGPLDDAAEQVLACLRAAFFSNKENPLWLFKSKQNPFPNLASLPAPPLDASRDFVKSTMEDCCEAWAATYELKPLMERTLNCLEQSSQLAVEAAKSIKSKLKPSDRDLQKAMENVISRLDDAEKYISISEEEVAKPLRVAVVGYMSHGKSSFINSLIGQRLIVSEAKGSTSCPMVIKHVDKQFEPSLHIDPDHFGEYLHTLQKVGRLATTTGSEENTLKLRHVWRNTALTKRQQANLLQFVDGFQFNPVYYGQKEIFEVQGIINDLIRLSAIFSRHVQELPKPKNSIWPELRVHMDEMAPLKETFELVDLPGFGDKLSKDTNILEQNHIGVLKKVQGVILVTALLDNDVTLHSLGAFKYGRNELEPHQAPLLLAVGTMVDRQNEGENWSLESENDFFQETFKCPKSTRLIKTAPGVYIDALHAQKYFESVPDDSKAELDLTTDDTHQLSNPIASSTSPVDDPMVPTRASLLEIKKTDPITYATLRRLYNYGTNYGKPGEDSRKYAKLTPAQLRSQLQTMIDAWSYQTVRGDIEEHVAIGGRNRRRLTETAKLIPYVDSVLEAEAAALRTSHGGEVVRKAIERRCQEFPDKMRATCQTWKVSKEEGLSAETSEIVDSSMTLVKKQAAAALDSVIMKKYKEHAMAPLKSQFKDVEHGIGFLVAVENALKAELNIIQDGTVKAIRLHARTVWSTSIQGLRKRVIDTLIGDNKKSFTEMREVLASDLKDLSAEAINGQVQQEIQDTIAEKLRMPRPDAQQKAISALQSTGMAAIRVAENLLLSPFKRNNKQPPSQNPTKSAPLAGNAADQKVINELGVASQNALGFLIRAPVLASAVDCPITREIWPWITSPPGVAIVIPSDRVKQQYTEMVLGPWEKILRKECKASLEGAIRLSITRGTKCVEDVIRRKTAELGMIRDSSETFSPEALGQVNLLWVNALSSRAITHIACKNLYNNLAASDELSRQSLPDIP